MVSVVIHTNPHLANQVETGNWLHRGFKRQGLDSQITASKTQAGDYHVVQGPWYAFNDWLGQPNVLWLDRTFWGDARFDLSIGWLNPDGSRDFRNADKTTPNGTLPELKPPKQQREAAAVLADYGKEVEAEHWVVDARQKYHPVFLKHHPAGRDYAFDWTREQLWERCDVAIGGSSTVLVEAAINGLHVESHDPRHVCQNMGDRESWLIKLSWAMWNHNQIQKGHFWEHLNDQD